MEEQVDNKTDNQKEIENKDLTKPPEEHVQKESIQQENDGKEIKNIESITPVSPINNILF
jgi:hypothetical protein